MKCDHWCPLYKGLCKIRPQCNGEIINFEISLFLFSMYLFFDICSLVEPLSYQKKNHNILLAPSLHDMIDKILMSYIFLKPNL